MKPASALLISLLTPLVGAIPVRDPRQSSQIQITGVSTSGSGCPQGSVSTNISPDGSVLTLGFDSYQTLVGPGASGSDREKNCDVFLTLRFPVGVCTAATLSITYHGFAEIESDVAGSLAASYTLSPGSGGGNPPATTFTASNWSGGGVYTRQDAVSASATIQNPNQRDVSLAVRTRLILSASNSGASGTLTADDATVAIAQRRC
ncbi:hypothetical protein VTK73DRAFT_10215 [Phialemonium thermophilum]|uniref:Secreted protein n=1 Tax=Phialemonium thermophilum TaxID=223376 RepID=A0ABR3VXV8_9PEZI